MREIKFRVWEFLHEKMHYLKNRDFAWLGETALNSKYYEVMQFTGFKDKYGKEIYERDILIDNSGEKFLVMYYDIRSGYYLQVLRTEMMNDIDEGECLSAYKILKELNKRRNLKVSRTEGDSK